jgi:mono/diheme cytochrome c family protein
MRSWLLYTLISVKVARHRPCSLRALQPPGEKVIMSKFSPRIGLPLIAAALCLSPAGMLVAGDDGPEPGTYRIIDGKVDGGTYAGWFVYHLSCHMCHGQDAVATSVAPDLMHSLKTMTQEQFADQVLGRYRILQAPADGPPDEVERKSIIEEVLQHRRGVHGQLAMPVWNTDPGMKPHILDLYAYLKARADGAIGPGRPKTMDE